MRNKDRCLCFSLSTYVSLINVSTMFCLPCALSRNSSRNSSLREAKPAGHLFVWFAKHRWAKNCLSFRGHADECEKQFRFVFRICLAFFDVRSRFADWHMHDRPSGHLTLEQRWNVVKIRSWRCSQLNFEVDLMYSARREGSLVRLYYVFWCIPLPKTRFPPQCS